MSDGSASAASPTTRASSGACAKCGLTRGAEFQRVGPRHLGRGGRARGAPAERPAWQRWLRFWWIPALAVVLVVGYFTTARRGDDGALSPAGRVTVDDLQVGDCFSSGRRDRNQRRRRRAVQRTTRSSRYSPFATTAGRCPSPMPPTRAPSTICAWPFEDVRRSILYEDSEIYADMITPTEEAFDDGDREYICYPPRARPEDFNEDLVLTESLRGAAR